jgi:epoxyqueuosine reductase
VTPKQAIQEKALDAGFPLIGFTCTTIPEENTERYHRWVAAGKYATMDWASKSVDERADARFLLPSAETVIALGMPYKTPEPKIRPGEKIIARYARGYDYHDVIMPRLKEISEFIKMIFPEAEFAFSVDSGRLQEKAFAIQAGLGWRGKNSLVINEKYGSFFFIGVIVTNIKFDFDSPVNNLCGSCRACIESCPVDAIDEDAIVDSRLCLSHWLNEGTRKYTMPEEIRKDVGNRLYGCETCQDVCPFNKKAPYSEIQEFFPRLNRAGMTKEEIADMTQEVFSRRFKLSPVKRAKLKGLRDNAGLPRE